MDLLNVPNRIMILECLRENSFNMRVEQTNLRDRISQTLVNARTSLLYIRQLNSELQEMKTIVDNALAANFQDLQSVKESPLNSLESIEDTLIDSSTGEEISEELLGSALGCHSKQ